MEPHNFTEFPTFQEILSQNDQQSLLKLLEMSTKVYPNDVNGSDSVNQNPKDLVFEALDTREFSKYSEESLFETNNAGNHTSRRPIMPTCANSLQSDRHASSEKDAIHIDACDMCGFETVTLPENQLAGLQESYVAAIDAYQRCVADPQRKREDEYQRIITTAIRSIQTEESESVPNKDIDPVYAVILGGIDALIAASSENASLLPALQITTQGLYTSFDTLFSAGGADYRVSCAYYTRFCGVFDVATQWGNQGLLSLAVNAMILTALCTLLPHDNNANSPQHSGDTPTKHNNHSDKRDGFTHGQRLLMDTVRRLLRLGRSAAYTADISTTATRFTPKTELFVTLDATVVSKLLQLRSADRMDEEGVTGRCVAAGRSPFDRSGAQTAQQTAQFSERNGIITLNTDESGFEACACVGIHGGVLVSTRRGREIRCHMVSIERQPHRIALTTTTNNITTQTPTHEWVFEAAPSLKCSRLWSKVVVEDVGQDVELVCSVAKLPVEGTSVFLMLVNEICKTTHTPARIRMFTLTLDEEHASCRVVFDSQATGDVDTPPSPPRRQSPGLLSFAVSEACRFATSCAAARISPHITSTDTHLLMSAVRATGEGCRVEAVIISSLRGTGRLEAFSTVLPTSSSSPSLDLPVITSSLCDSQGYWLCLKDIGVNMQEVDVCLSMDGKVVLQCPPRWQPQQLFVCIQGDGILELNRRQEPGATELGCSVSEAPQRGTAGWFSDVDTLLALKRLAGEVCGRSTMARGSRSDSVTVSVALMYHLAIADVGNDAADPLQLFQEMLRLSAESLDDAGADKFETIMVNACLQLVLKKLVNRPCHSVCEKNKLSLGIFDIAGTDSGAPAHPMFTLASRSSKMEALAASDTNSATYLEAVRNLEDKAAGWSPLSLFQCQTGQDSGMLLAALRNVLNTSRNDRLVSDIIMGLICNSHAGLVSAAAFFESIPILLEGLRSLPVDSSRLPLMNMLLHEAVCCTMQQMGCFSVAVLAQAVDAACRAVEGSNCYQWRACTYTAREFASQACVAAMHNRITLQGQVSADDLSSSLLDAAPANAKWRLSLGYYPSITWGPVELMAKSPPLKSPEKTPPRFREAGLSPGTNGDTAPSTLRMLALNNSTRSPARVDGSPLRALGPRSPADSPASPFLAAMSPLRGPSDLPPLVDSPSIDSFTLDGSASGASPLLLGASAVDGDAIESIAMSPSALFGKERTVVNADLGSENIAAPTVLSAFRNKSLQSGADVDAFPLHHDEVENDHVIIASQNKASTWSTQQLFAGFLGEVSKSTSGVARALPELETSRRFLLSSIGRHYRRDPEVSDTIECLGTDGSLARSPCPSWWSFHLQSLARNSGPKVYKEVAWDTPSVNRAERAVAAALLWHVQPDAARVVIQDYLATIQDSTSKDSNTCNEAISHCFKAARKIRKWLADTRRIVNTDRKLYEKLAPGLERRALFLLRITPSWYHSRSHGEDDKRTVEKQLLQFVTSYSLHPSESQDFVLDLSQAIREARMAAATASLVSVALQNFTVTMPGDAQHTADSVVANTIRDACEWLDRETSQGRKTRVYCNSLVQRMRDVCSDIIKWAASGSISAWRFRCFAATLPFHRLIDLTDWNDSAISDVIAFLHKQFIRAWQHAFVCAPAAPMCEVHIDITSQSSRASNLAQLLEAPKHKIGTEVELEHVRSAKTNVAPRLPTLEIRIPDSRAFGQLDLELFAGDYSGSSVRDVLISVSPVDSDGDYDQFASSWPHLLEDNTPQHSSVFPVPTTYGGIDLTGLHVRAASITPPSQLDCTATGSPWSFPTRVRMVHDGRWARVFTSDRRHAINSNTACPVHYHASWPVRRIRVAFLAAHDGGSRLQVPPFRIFSRCAVPLVLQRSHVQASSYVLGALAMLVTIGEASTSRMLPHATSVGPSTAEESESAVQANLTLIQELLVRSSGSWSGSDKAATLVYLRSLILVHTGRVRHLALLLFLCLQRLISAESSADLKEMVINAVMSPECQTTEKFMILKFAVLLNFLPPNEALRLLDRDGARFICCMLNHNYLPNMMAPGKSPDNVSTQSCCRLIQQVHSRLQLLHANASAQPILVARQRASEQLQLHLLQQLIDGSAHSDIGSVLPMLSQDVHRALANAKPAQYFMRMLQNVDCLLSEGEHSTKKLTNTQTVNSTGKLTICLGDSVVSLTTPAGKEFSGSCEIVGRTHTLQHTSFTARGFIYDSALVLPKTGTQGVIIDMRSVIKCAELAREDLAAAVERAIAHSVDAASKAGASLAILLGVCRAMLPEALSCSELCLVCVSDDEFEEEVRWNGIDLRYWADNLTYGSMVDSIVPMMESWAPGVIHYRASKPFDHWFRVDFGVKGDECIRRWVPWEYGFAQSSAERFVAWGDNALLPLGWLTGRRLLSVNDRRLCDQPGGQLSVPANRVIPDARQGSIVSQVRAKLSVFRDTLHVGDNIDALDCHHKWYEARVVDASAEEVRVRFLGWCPRSQPDKYDEWIPRRSDRILPKGCKIRDWRRIQVGDDIEVRDDRTVDTNRISEVDVSRRAVRVGGGSTWISIDDIYSIACHSTHRRPREWAAADWEGINDDLAASEVLWLRGFEKTLDAMQRSPRAGNPAARYGFIAPELVAKPQKILDSITFSPNEGCGAICQFPVESAELTWSGWLNLSCMPSDQSVVLYQNALLDLPLELPRGLLVEARYGALLWYPARIEKLNADGTYAVSYEDGDRSPSLPRSRLRPRAEARQSLALTLDSEGRLQLKISFVPAPDAIDFTSVVDPLERVCETWEYASISRLDMSMQLRKAIHLPAQTVVSLVSSVRMEPGDWHHVSVRVTPGLICLDVDGVCVSSAIAELYPRSSTLYIGPANRLPCTMPKEGRGVRCIVYDNQCDWSSSTVDKLAKMWMLNPVSAELRDVHACAAWTDEISLLELIPQQVASLASVQHRARDILSFLRSTYRHMGVVPMTGYSESKTDTESLALEGMGSSCVESSVPTAWYEQLRRYSSNARCARVMMKHFLSDDLSDHMSWHARSDNVDAALASLLQRKADDASIGTGGGISCHVPLELSKSASMLSLGSIVYIDAYNVRLPAVITGTLERHKRYTVRLLPVEHAGLLGGASIAVETHNMYAAVIDTAITTRIEFIPIMFHYQRLRRMEDNDPSMVECQLDDRVVRLVSRLETMWQSINADSLSTIIKYDNVAQLCDFFSAKQHLSCKGPVSPSTLLAAVVDDACTSSLVHWIIRNLSLENRTHKLCYAISTLQHLLTSISQASGSSCEAIRELIAPGTVKVLINLLKSSSDIGPMSPCNCCPHSCAASIVHCVVLILRRLEMPSEQAVSSLRADVQVLLHALHMAERSVEPSRRCLSETGAVDVLNAFVNARNACQHISGSDLARGYRPGTLECEILDVADMTAVIVHGLPTLALDLSSVANLGLPTRLSVSVARKLFAELSSAWRRCSETNLFACVPRNPLEDHVAAMAKRYSLADVRMVTRDIEDVLKAGAAPCRLGLSDFPDSLLPFRDRIMEVHTYYNWLPLDALLPKWITALCASLPFGAEHHAISLLNSVLILHSRVFTDINAVPALASHHRRLLLHGLCFPVKLALWQAFVKVSQDTSTPDRPDHAGVEYAVISPPFHLSGSSEIPSGMPSLLPSTIILQSEMKNALQGQLAASALLEEIPAALGHGFDAIPEPDFAAQSVHGAPSPSEGPTTPRTQSHDSPRLSIEDQWLRDGAEFDPDMFHDFPMAEAPSSPDVQALDASGWPTGRLPLLHLENYLDGPPQDGHRLSRPLAALSRSMLSEAGGSNVAHGHFHLALLEQFDVLLGLLEGRGIPRSHLRSADANEFSGPLTRVRINRWKQGDQEAATTIFEQLFQQVYCGSLTQPHALRRAARPWRVELLGEGGLDAGGLFSEVMTALCEELMGSEVELSSSPHPPLFVPTPNCASKLGVEQDTLIPNPQFGNHGSATYPQLIAAAHRYIFLGRIIGVALRVGFQLPLRLPPLVMLLITGNVADATSHDIEAVQQAVGRIVAEADNGHLPKDDAGRVDWMLPSAERGREGPIQVPILPEDDLLPRRFATSAKSAFFSQFLPQCSLIAQGISSVVPMHILSLFHPREFERLVCGAPGIDVELLRKHTRYEGFGEQSPVIQRFWRVLSSLTPDEQENVMKFIYARRRLPAETAFTQPFTIARLARDDPDSTLPQAHSCTFQLDLPEHSTDEVLRRQLLRASELCACYDLDGGARGLQGE